MISLIATSWLKQDAPNEVRAKIFLHKNAMLPYFHIIARERKHKQICSTCSVTISSSNLSNPTVLRVATRSKSYLQYAVSLINSNYHESIVINSNQITVIRKTVSPNGSYFTVSSSFLTLHFYIEWQHKSCT